LVNVATALLFHLEILRMASPNADPVNWLSRLLLRVERNEVSRWMGTASRFSKSCINICDNKQKYPCVARFSVSLLSVNMSHPEKFSEELS
jgi:hypothetical protein